MHNPTYEDIAFADAKAKGITCRSCEHWRRHEQLDRENHEYLEYCYLKKRSFPRICRFYEYEPGSDEGVENE